MVATSTLRPPPAARAASPVRAAEEAKPGRTSLGDLPSEIVQLVVDKLGASDLVSVEECASGFVPFATASSAWKPILTAKLDEYLPASLGNLTADACHQRAAVVGYKAAYKELIVERCRAAVESGATMLWKLPLWVRDEEPVVLAALTKQGGAALERASPRLQRKAAVVLAAMRVPFGSESHRGRPTAMWFMDRAALSYDLHFLVEAARIDPRAIEFACKRLRNSQALVSPCCAGDPLMLAHVSERFRNDGDLVKSCVSRDGRALQHASAALRNDPEIVALAVAHWPDAIEHAGPLARDDEGVVLAMMQRMAAYPPTSLYQERPRADNFKHASDRLRNDVAFVAQAIELSTHHWRSAGPLPRDDVPLARRMHALCEHSARSYAGPNARAALDADAAPPPSKSFFSRLFGG